MEQTQIKDYLSGLTHQVKQFPVIWDMNHPEYGPTVATSDAWKGIAANIIENKDYKELSAEDVRFSWNSMKRSYFLSKKIKPNQFIFDHYSSINWLPNSADDPEDMHQNYLYISSKETKVNDHNDKPYMKHRYYSLLVLLHWSLLPLLWYVFNSVAVIYDFKTREKGSSWINLTALMCLITLPATPRLRMIVNWGRDIHLEKKTASSYTWIIHLILAIIYITLNVCAVYVSPPDTKLESSASIFIFLTLLAMNMEKSYFFFAKRELEEILTETINFALEQVITFLTVLSFVIVLGVPELSLFLIYLMLESVPLGIYYWRLNHIKYKICGYCQVRKQYHYKATRPTNRLRIHFIEIITHKHEWKPIGKAKKMIV